MFINFQNNLIKNEYLPPGAQVANLHRRASGEMTFDYDKLYSHHSIVRAHALMQVGNLRSRQSKKG